MNPRLPPDDLPDDATLSYKGNCVRTTMGTAVFPSSAGDSDSWQETVAKGPMHDPTVDGAPALESEYRMLRRVAQGGMGEVWEAVQVSLGRVVAVKVVRGDRLARQGGSKSEALFQEFRREALFAARLEHPNILPVHDLGTDDNGAPLLAMKYVQGVPWDKELKSDFKNLTPPQLLGRHLPLLISVAQAVAFAHSRGVVHRDLKPAQVMLGEFGEVLLLDWGLAVFVGDDHQRDEMRKIGLPDLERNETATNPSGTPALMAPEQTEDDARNIGTWTDVYLLGGTLYFLLTGHYPHEAATGQLSFVKASRGFVTPPSERTPERDIPQDLEELCLSALQPRPADRCRSALVFIEALKNHLSGETRRRESTLLTAETESQLSRGSMDYQTFAACAARLEQAQGLWNGNPSLAPLRERVFAGHSGLALRNGDLVLARLQAQRMEIGAARIELLDKVSEEEARALNRLRTRRIAIGASFALLALAIVGGAVFTHKLSLSRDAEMEQRSIAERQRDLAADAREKSDEFARFVLEDMTDQLSSLERLDLLDPAIQRAFAYYNSLPLEKLPAGDRRFVAEGYLSVIVASRLRGNTSIQQEAEAAVAKLLDSLPRTEQSGPAWEKVEQKHLAEKCQLLITLGDVEGALEAGRRSVEIRERILEQDPASPAARFDLSDGYMELSTIHAGTMQTTESLRLAELAIQMDEKTLAELPDDPTVHGHLVQTLNNKVVTLSRAPRSQAIDPAVGRLAEESRRLSTRFPNEPAALGTAASGFSGLAEWHYTHGSTEDALAYIEEAMKSLRSLAVLDPAKPGTQSLMMNALGTMMVLYQRQGRLDDAAAAMREAIEIGEGLLARDPANSNWAGQMQVYLNNSIVLLLDMKQLDEADRMADRLLGLAAAQYARAPELQDTARSLCMAQLRKAGVLLQMNRPAEAVSFAREGVKLTDQFAAQFPDSLVFRGDRVAARSWLSGALSNSGDEEGARAIMEELVELTRENTQLAPTSREAWEHLASILSSLSTMETDLGKLHDSLEHAQESVDSYRHVLDLDPGRFSSMITLAQSLQRVADAALSVGKHEESERASREAMELARRCIAIEPDAIRAYAALCNGALAIARMKNDNAFEAEAAAMMKEAREAEHVLRERANLLDESQRLDVDTILNRIAITSTSIGCPGDALADHQAVRESRSHDQNPIFSDLILMSRVDDNEARALLEFGHVTKAIELSTIATLTLTQLRNENPELGLVPSELGTALTTLGHSLLWAGEWDAANEAALKAETIWREAIREDPGSPLNGDALGRALRMRAESLYRSGRASEALPLLEEAVAVQRGSVQAGSKASLDGWNATNYLLARVLVATGDASRARKVLDETAATLSPEGDSDAAKFFRDRLYWRAEAETRTALGDEAGARQAWENVVIGFTPRETCQAPLRQRALLAVALLKLGRVEEAQEIRDEVEKSELKGAEILRMGN